jgi:trk system potassium uptake protein
VNIVITGAGEVGRHLADNLSNRDHNITIIEANEVLARELDEQLDSRVMCADGTNVATLAEAGAADCDLLLALTSNRNVNLVSASLGGALGARKTVARVDGALQRNEWLFDYRTHFKIDHLFSVERLTAVEMAKHIRNPERLVVEEFARGRIELLQCTIPAAAPAIGRPLLDLKLPGQVRVALIQRGSEIIVPTACDQVQPGDIATLFGNPDKLSSALPLFDPQSRPRSETKVVIFSGGEYGAMLAQMLEGREHFHVRIIERRKDRCEELVELLQRTTVIHGDATSVAQLKEEQVGDADFFVATSHDDEDNVMTCLQARNLGTRYCLTLVHRADYADTISANEERLGIHAAVSPRVAAGKELMRFITSDAYHEVMSLPGGASVLELTVPPDSGINGRTVAEIKWPAGSGLVALLHGQQALVPGGSDVIHAGDTVYALTTEAARKPFIRLLREQ